MAMFYKLPNELILYTVCMLTDIRDIMSLFETNEDIKQIIMINFNYIFKNIIKNNSISYPQMSKLLSCFYHKNKHFHYNNINSHIIKNICNYISIVSREDIISNNNNLNEVINQHRNVLIDGTEDENTIKILKNSIKPYNIYKKYYYFLIIKKINHIDSTRAAIHLDNEQIDKFYFYLNMHFEPSIAIDMAMLTEEQMMNVNLITRHKVDIALAISAVNSTEDEEIPRVLEIFKRGVPFENALDAIIDNLENHEIDNMCKLISEGIEPTIARACCVYSEEYQRIMLHLYNKKVDINMIEMVIESFFDNKINGFVTMIDNNIDVNYAFEVLHDETINEEQFSEFINLIKNKINYTLAMNIVKIFNSIQIIKFNTIINLGINQDIAYDVVDIFDNTQIIDFLKLINEGFKVDASYDMVILYNEDQRIVCKEFIKHNMSYSLVESYNEEQIKKIIDMIQNGVNFHSVISIIDNEPCAKRRR